MSKPKPVYPPKREVKKTLITIPADQIEMIDNCAKAIGMSRSSFLQVYFDTYAEQVVNFTEGWLANIGYYYKKRQENKLIQDAKETAEGLGANVTVAKAKERRKTDEQ